MLTEKSKYSAIKASLIEDIRSCKLTPGQKLAGERQLAERFGVSSKTAKRAINEMVAEEILETRNRSGTYVRGSAWERFKVRTLNIICTAYENHITRTFLDTCSLQAKKRSWRPHVIRVHPDLTRPAIQAISSGEFCIAMLDGEDLQGPIGRALVDNASQVILVGNDLSAIGVSSVLCDDAMGMHMAMDYLHAMGRREIGMVIENPDSLVTQQQISIWKSYYDDREVNLDERIILSGNKAFQCPMKFAYNTTKAFLAAGNVKLSALISLNSEATAGIAAACRDTGLRVPDDIAIVNMGEAPMLKFMAPEIVCIDPDIPAHISEAVRLLEERESQDDIPSVRKILITPKLLER